jgi:ActR/RegA family two-component response regulator
MTPIEITDMLAKVADWAVDVEQVETVIYVLRKNMLEALLQVEGQNQCAVARRLGIHRNSLQRLLKKHGICLRRKSNGYPVRKNRRAA